MIRTMLEEEPEPVDEALKKIRDYNAKEGCIDDLCFGYRTGNQ